MSEKAPRSKGEHGAPANQSPERGPPAREEYWIAGRHLVTYSSWPFFNHPDWLGTDRYRSTPTAGQYGYCVNDPFGDNQWCPTADGDISPVHFTGKERDGSNTLSPTNLDNFGARFYSSAMGRFMTPDPLGGHQEDPQTLNKYSYVRNNPLSLTDPTGLDFNLTCTQESNTCHNGLQGTWTSTTDANGHTTNSFTATDIHSDKNGNLFDQTGNQYSASVDASGVHFTENGSSTSSTGTWVNGSPDTNFTQTTGALAGFSFDFSQPGKGQSFSGTFSTDTNFYGAKSALEKAGFSVSYLDECCNVYEMVHNWSLVNFRSPGDPNTGRNSVHFLVNPGDKVGLVVPTTGKLHGYETNPNVSPLEHLRNDVPW